MINKLKKLIFSRVFIVGLLILLQLAMIFSVAIRFTQYFVVYYAVSLIMAVVFVLRIIYTNQHMAYKLAWVIVVLIFPAFGAALYLIFCGNRLSPHSADKMRIITEITESTLEMNKSVIDSLRKENPTAELQARYIQNATKYPVLKNNRVEYFKTGEEVFPVMLEELEKAEKYIFLEYFIISPGKMWDRVHEILLRKAKEGVDVRIIYDDVGSIMTLDRKFYKRIEREGISCRVFHRFLPVLSARQNNRDHRKILVIDGKTAFTGGINISDEYINETVRFGYWKDNAVLVSGDGAWSFTVMFLSMWDYLNHTSPENRGKYDSMMPEAVRSRCLSDDIGGYIQPYSDTPLDNEPVGENVYLGIIASAQDYLWITTPYLIIDERIEGALLKAAKSGVDVRIITPGIPDKRIVYETTKSYYPNLINGGVKIYEYKPGFIHAKTFLCDDRYATVGSVNLDYRSLYLHFECGLWMYDTDCIADIKKDFEEMFLSSEMPKMTGNGLIKKLFRGVLELLAPLL